MVAMKLQLRTSGRVECTAESSSVDCNAGAQEVDLSNVDDEIVVVN